MPDRIDVMISSTALDLPDHRAQAERAVLRMNMHPIAMENLAAMSADAIDASLKMVDEAEIYLGIFGQRYGYIPDSPKNPDRLSITELEYRRAVQRDIPRLIFLMGDDHPITARDLETNPDGAAKLLRLRNELKASYVASFFNSPDQLREQVITALAPYRVRDAAGSMHYISDIPQPPEAYIAHPYVLLTSPLAGRQKELNLLTDWVAKPGSDVYPARILNVVAIGGMGKSALTWKWFNDIAPLEMKPLAGRLWWSFYESDARWENFIIRALAYVTGRAREDIEQNTNPVERENLLLKKLNDEPYLLVLDGLERVLVAYARMDAAYLRDDELDEQTANRVAGALGLPESAGTSFVGQHLLRKTADPRAGNFLRKLAGVKASRILVSTRLYPADLQSREGGEIPGSRAYFLLGLDDDSAVDLWRSARVPEDVTMTGTRDELLKLFERFDNYPLLIRALAGEVARFRRAPGDFAAWQKANPNFDPFSVPLVQVKSHILYYALKDVADNAMKVLHTVAALRMPASYDTLQALLVGKEKPFETDTEFDAILSELEDRSLLGWDRRSNRYDLHPIIRGITWRAIDSNTQRYVYEGLAAYLRTFPRIGENEVEQVDDLALSIEYYNALVKLNRYDEAFEFFQENLNDPLVNRLNATAYNVELLELLFGDSSDPFPSLTESESRTYALNALAQSLQFSGQPYKAVEAFYSSIGVNHFNSDRNVHFAYRHITGALRHIGRLFESESMGRKAVKIARNQQERSREGEALYWLGMTQGYRGALNLSEATMKRCLTALRYVQDNTSKDKTRSESGALCHLSQHLFWKGKFQESFDKAIEAEELAQRRHFKRMIILAIRLQGMAALELTKWDIAAEFLHLALVEARLTNHTQEELATLSKLAEYYRRINKYDEARELLNDMWNEVERGHYPLFHADGMNVLAQIERDAGNTDAAIAAATRAYELAWCDGISADGKTCYAYWWGLQDAKKHLEALGAPIPQLEPFDESKHQPLPEIDWDALLKPDDEADD